MTPARVAVSWDVEHCLAIEMHGHANMSFEVLRCQARGRGTQHDFHFSRFGQFLPECE